LDAITSQMALGVWREVDRIAFEKEKELTDRALKLAELGKAKSNWELTGLLSLASFVVGFLVR
jgi:hypothetical protein